MKKTFDALRNTLGSLEEMFSSLPTSLSKKQNLYAVAISYLVNDEKRLISIFKLAPSEEQAVRETKLSLIIKNDPNKIEIITVAAVKASEKLLDKIREVC